MDSRRIGQLVLLGGLLVAGAGFAQLLLNQPIESRSGFVGVFDDVKNLVENSDRAASRQRASQIMEVGAVIILAGGAVRLYASAT